MYGAARHYDFTRNATAVNGPIASQQLLRDDLVVQIIYNGGAFGRGDSEIRDSNVLLEFGVLVDDEFTRDQSEGDNTDFYGRAARAKGLIRTLQKRVQFVLTPGTFNIEGMRQYERRLAGSIKNSAYFGRTLILRKAGNRQ